MDKYHIYEEVGTGKHSQVFKGRERMKLEYVAIKRVQKCMMHQVVNEVQVIHRLNSPNVLKFHDWYETRNNVWLILEFCTGGDLLAIIEQDRREPESAVRLFGVDLLAGLQQAHASGFVHGNLRPSNVLIDEYGILKLSGFGLARSVANNGDDRDASGSGESGALAAADVSRIEGRWSGDPAYMAPELFLEGAEALSFASDFWSLGCILFELFTGEPPFGKSSSPSVAERVQLENHPGLDGKGWHGVRMSLEFGSLVGSLLNKDPHKRPTWPQLLAHPFWGRCRTPSPLAMPAQPRFDRAAAAAASLTETMARKGPRLHHRPEESHTQCQEESARAWGGDARDELPNDAGSTPIPPTLEPGEDSAQMHKFRPLNELGNEVASGLREGSGNTMEDRRLRDRALEAERLDDYSSLRCGTTESGIRSGLGEGEETSESSRSYSPVKTILLQHTDTGISRGAPHGYRSGRLHVVNEAELGIAEDDEEHSQRAERAAGVGQGEQAELRIDTDERDRAPGHGSDGIFEPSSGARVVAANEPARRAAALDSLRLRGKIAPSAPVVTTPAEGRVSPPVSASASSSVGEQYGSSFEEDTEGSSSNSAGLGIEGAALETTMSWSSTSATAVASTAATPTTLPASLHRVTVLHGIGVKDCTPSFKRSTIPPASTAADGPIGSQEMPQRDAGRRQGAAPVVATPGGSASGSDSASDSRGSAMTSRGTVRGYGLGFSPCSGIRSDPMSVPGAAENHMVEPGRGSSPGEAGNHAVSKPDKEHLGPSHERVFPPSWAKAGRVAGTRASDAATEPEKWANDASTATRVPQTSWSSSPSDGCSTAAVERQETVSNKHFAPGRIEDDVETAMHSPTPCGTMLRDTQDGSSRLHERAVERNTHVASSSRNDRGEHTNFQRRPDGSERDTRLESLRALLIHSGDAQVTPIVSNRSLESVPLQAGKAPSAKTRPSAGNQLHFEALPPGEAAALSPSQLELHLNEVYNVLTNPSSSSQQRRQILLYLKSLAPVPRLANVLINSTFIALLLRLLRRPLPATTRGTIATLLGLLVRHATYIPRSAGGRAGVDVETVHTKRGREREGHGNDADSSGGLMSTLIAVIGERASPGRDAQCASLRQGAMAALGELLFYAVTQESPVMRKANTGSCHNPSAADMDDSTARSKSWYIPVAAVGGAIGGCLEDTGHESVQFYAAKTIENVLAQARTSHALVRLLVMPGVALRLFDLSRHASSEGLKGTAATGLSHLLFHDLVGNDTVLQPAVPTHGQGEADRINANPTNSRTDDGRREASDPDLDPAQVAACVMCEPGAPAAVVSGLSEGNSPSIRRAFLNIFNIVLWGSCRSRRDGVNMDGVGPGQPVRSAADCVPNAEARPAARRGGNSKSPLQRAAEAMLDASMLLPRLLRIAEYGEDQLLRAKGFLALRLALDSAPPSFLPKACRSRLLQIPVRVIEAVRPRADPRIPCPSKIPPRRPSQRTPQQEYLRTCCARLTEALCALPGDAARHLAVELRKWRGLAIGREKSQENSRRERARGTVRRLTTKHHPADVTFRKLEAASLSFCAVVQLINNSYWRRQVVTRGFLGDFAACLAFSCPSAVHGVEGGWGDGVHPAVRQVRQRQGNGFLRAEPSSTDDCPEDVPLAALFPTAEALAQHAEESLLPHRTQVSGELLPVLCRLAKSPSGNTRMQTVMVLCKLVPHLLSRERISETNSNALQSRESPEVVAAVHSSIVCHFLPLIAPLLRDRPPIPLYVTRLLMSISERWKGFGTALLSVGGTFEALFDRLAQLGSSYLEPDRIVAPSSASSSSPSAGRYRSTCRIAQGKADALGVKTKELTQAVPGAAQLPALADLIAALVERDDGGGGRDEGRLITAMLKLELPRKVASVVTREMSRGISEATTSFLALANSLLDRVTRTSRGSPGTISQRTVHENEHGDEEGPLGQERGAWMSWAKTQLEPLLTAVPAVVDAMHQCRVPGGLLEREHMAMTARREVLSDDDVRSGISDAATAFLAACHQLFHDRLLRALFAPRLAAGGGPPTPTTSLVTRQLADVLSCSDIGEMPRLRILRLVLEAARERSCANVVRGSSLWTAVLRVAGDRFAGSGKPSRRTSGGRSVPVDCLERQKSVGVIQARARNMVGAVRGSGWGNGNSGLSKGGRERRTHER